MAVLPELDVARIRAYCEGRVPECLRAEARVEATLRGKSVTIFNCRPPWHPGLTEWSRVPVAQLRYDPGAGRWTLCSAITRSVVAFDVIDVPDEPPDVAGGPDADDNQVHVPALGRGCAGAA